MLRRYQGTPDAPYPPSPQYFRPVPAGDGYARQRASGLLGSLPPYHFVDERGPDALYRFFSYETPLGVSVSALSRALEGEPAVYGGGTLGQTNPNFVAPAVGSAADSAGQALQTAALALLNYLDANGVPSEHTALAQVGAFQTAYNADPISQGANGQLSVDSAYGANTQSALASIVGAVAPPPNTGASPTPPTPAQNTTEPVPAADATCTSWVVDASTPQVTAIAQNIAFHDSPVAWTDQGIYNTTVNGIAYRFVMWWENGLKGVAAYKCAAGPGALAQASVAGSSSAAPAIILGTLVVGGLVAVGFAAKKPLRSMGHHAHHYHHR